MKYIGITIGPIEKTLELAGAAREIWSASYIFSYLMQEIIREIKQKAGSYDVFLQPHAKAVEENKINLYGAGIIPDRLLLKIENN
ncbi:MAG: type III-B CRISPR-associated protein Cas10/Cmr2 [Bacteroidota bacterium]|nr:type III-B CRISPR-associated protein Cas10/Cmr2 [Bacteroidota bacterium]